MKILFLHLSDAHLTQETSLTKINPNAIANSLVQMGAFDECVLVFSGDIVNSGNKNEYKVAEYLFGRIIKSINDKYFDGNKHIQTLIVPGNHDNAVKNKSRSRNDIIGFYKDKNIDRHYYEDLDELENFYAFAKRNYCFTHNKNIHVRNLTFGSFKIKVNLINSATFSLLGSENGDKGLHYLPHKELDKFNFENQENYTISVIHHGPEWFSDETKKALYNHLYGSTDLLFVGHEHFSLNETKTVNGKHIDFSSGVALYGTKTEHGFNALILDTDAASLTGYKFTYNRKIYKPSTEPVIKNEHITFKSKYKFTHTSEYKKYLESDIEQREGEQYLKYFVFPSLETKNMNSQLDTVNITTEEKFMEVFHANQRITIEGNLKSGKTTLAKYLCLVLADEYVPLLLTEDSFGAKTNKNILKYALEEQFGSDTDCDEYLQMEKEKKVLIVDRSDRVNKEKWNSFMEEYENQFDHIILLCGVDWNINIKEKALEELEDKEVLYLKICPFYYSKRAELIQKVCESFDDKNISCTSDTVYKINEEITNQIKYFQLNPDFIHQYVNYYLNFSFLKTQNDNNVFSKVFEANITFRLAQNTKQENVDEILVALDFVAHRIHFNKRYPLPIPEFEAAINEYNSRYDNNLTPKMVYDIAKKSNIIKEVPNKFGIEFCDENLLAYFTALHLNRGFNEGQCEEELKYILNNICFEINGDIILFLSYITSNVQILNPIMKSMIQLMHEWDEFSFEKNNIEFLSKRTVPHIKQSIPDKEEKKDNIKEKNEAEKAIVEEKQKNAESLYSYDESNVDSFSNKIAKSLNYLELVAKILPNFRHILKGDEKKEIVRILYTYPNKLLYFMLSDIDQNIDRLIEEILSKNPKTKRGMLITKDMLEKSLQTQAIGYILSIYDFIACTASVGKGMDELNKFSYNNNLNYMLQNIMMEENNGNFYNFSVKAENLYDTVDSDMIKNMVIMVVRKYFLNHEIVLTGKAQHVADKFFKQEDKKKLQLLQAKNRIVKK